MEWRFIAEFGEKYQVSDEGQVRNTANGLILKQHYAGSTIMYPVVCLCNGSAKVRGNKPKYARRYVHRLVAEAFVPNVDGKPEINHIDNNPHNNEARNLEWVTHAENMQHALKYGNAAYRKKKVVRDDGAEYESIAEAAAAMDYEVSNMSKACRNGWRVRGHLFAFAETLNQANAS